MLSILMIDDDEAVTATVKEYVTQNVPDVVFNNESDFTKAVARVQDVRPDVLILDVYHGNPATGDIAAQPVWNEIWKNWFCPLVFYSAGDIDVQPAPPENHPFVRVIQKGAGTEVQVAAELNSFQVHVGSIRSVQAELGQVTHSVLRDISSHVFAVEADAVARTDLLVRAARRRVAARMDEELAGTSEPLHPWEQYIHPPLTKHLVLGDLLRATQGDTADAAAYRLVLTPTCDTVPHGKTGLCKVTNVLAAKGCDPQLFVTKGLTLDAKTAEKTLKEKVLRALNDPHQSGIGVLPPYPGVLPLLAVDYRELQLIPVGAIALGGEVDREYVRIASIDSPFREFAAWAFLQVSCRPGVPPRKMDLVADELVAHMKKHNAKEGK